MKSMIRFALTLFILVAGLEAQSAPNSGTYVTVTPSLPSLKYKEGQQAGFSIYEVGAYAGHTEVDVFYQNESNPLTVSNVSTYRHVSTPTLTYGPVSVIFKVYEITEPLYKVMLVTRTLRETFTIDFNVQYNDSTPPVLANLPAEDAVLIDDMPFLQVNYSDAPAGVDISTFKAFITDSGGTRTEVTSLFTVTSSFATVQFDALHKIQVGVFFLEASIADFNENLATKTTRYAIEIPAPTTGYFTGKVVDASGAIVPGASISIITGGVLSVRTAVVTDALGEFALPVGQGGDVLLSATKTNWTSQDKWVTGETGKDSAVPTFVIKPLDSTTTYIAKATGGTARNTANTVEFVVQPNAASSNINLNITQAQSLSELPGALPSLSEFTFMGTMGPSGTTFSPAGKLRVKNNLGFPANTPIVVGMYNKEMGAWEDSGGDGVVSADGQYVEYNMSHFSSWDANQPVVPPVAFQPSAKANTPDVGGRGEQCAGCRIDIEKGNLGVDYELPSVVRFGKAYRPVFTYWSQSARPMLFADAQQSFPNIVATDYPDLIQVQFKMGDQFKKIYYKGKGSITAGETIYSYRMMMEAKGVDNQYMPTGVYDYNVSIGNDYANSRFATAFFFGAPPLTPLATITTEPVSLKYHIDSRAVVINSRNSAFGKGWTMQGLEKLTPTTGDRVIWEDGSGLSSMYTGIPFSMMPNFRMKSLTKSGNFNMEIKSLQMLEKMSVTAMIEKSGSIFVADCDRNQIYAVAIDGAVSVVAGTGQAGFSGDGGNALNAQLSCPTSVASSYDGGLLIADKDNFRIRKISKNGIIKTIAGNGQNVQSPDAPKAATLSIGAPVFVSEDKLHSVHFITEDMIRFVDPRGRLSTLIAKDNAYYKVNLNNPTQMLYDERDNPIIVDTGNNRIIKVFLQTGDVRVLAGDITEERGEKVSVSMDAAAGTKLPHPIFFVVDKKAQVSYVLDESGSIHVLAHDGRLIKTRLKSRFKNLVLSKNLGLIGVKSGSEAMDRYVSPAGDFSTLHPVVAGSGWRRQDLYGNQSFFNAEGLLIGKSTPDGKTESFTYDVKGRLATWVIPGGDTFTFAYDLYNGRLKQVADPTGRITLFYVNNAGQLTSIQNNDGKTRSFGYNATDQMTSETYEDARTNQYVYSANGLLSQEIAPDGRVRVIKPTAGIAQMGDIANGVGTIQNPADTPVISTVYGMNSNYSGKVTQFRTDKYGKAVETFDALGNRTFIVRDANGLPTSIRDPLAGQTSFTYNALGLPTYVSDPDGVSSYFQYGNFGRITKVTEAGASTDLAYDTSGNLTQIKDTLLRATNMQYLDKGLLSKVTDYLGNETNFTYNAKGLIATSTEALGKATEFTYNNVGLLSQSKDALNQVTSYEYDSLNRLTKIIDPMSGQTTFTYTNAGLIQSLTDSKNQTTSYTYNSRGWLASTTNALSQTEFYTYDPDGQMISRKQLDGSIINYDYDDTGKLVRVGAPDEETKFNYDANGRLTWASNKSSSVTRKYTPGGRIKTEFQQGYAVSYAYNQHGLRTGLVANGIQNQYSYNAVKALIGIQSQINGQSYSWSREYDQLNRPVKDILPNAVQVQRTFTALSQVASINNLNPSLNLISGFGYSYDAVGKRTSKSESSLAIQPSGKLELAAHTNDYTYDTLGRVTQATGPREIFSFDIVGNRRFQPARRTTPSISLSATVPDTLTSTI